MIRRGRTAEQLLVPIYVENQEGRIAYRPELELKKQDRREGAEKDK